MASKKGLLLLLMLMLMIFTVACGDGEDTPEGDDNGKSEALEEDEAQEDPKLQEPSEENDEEAPAPDDEKEEIRTTDYSLKDMEFDWEGEIDFQANELEDWLITDDKIHFLYEKEGALFYQSLDLNCGEELSNKKVEGAPTPEDFEISRDISFELHEFNGRVYGIIGQNDKISEERWDQLPEALQQEQRMMIIDIENNETILSKTPMIDEFRIPDTGITGESNTYPGFLFDVTADGRYVMILHSAPGMSAWENYLYFSTDQNQEELEEKNKEVLKQFEDAPLWVYDLQEDALTEIPYKDEIDTFVPYHVQGLENGVNMIFTDQEGWLTLDIENQQVRKTEEGGAYRRTEPGVPGAERYRRGTPLGENLFFTDVQEMGEICGIPIFHYLWNVEDEQLEHLGIIGPNWYKQTFYFNDTTGEILVNSVSEINEDESETDRDERGYVERIYRLTFEEEKVLQNHGDEPVESLQELDGFQVVNMMEFPIGNYPEGEPRLSIRGDGYNALPIKDFHHRGYGVLVGRTIEEEFPNTFPLFYAYQDEEGEGKIVEIDGADLIDATETHILIFNNDLLRAYDIDEFFDALEKK